MKIESKIFYLTKIAKCGKLKLHIFTVLPLKDKRKYVDKSAKYQQAILILIPF